MIRPTMLAPMVDPATTRKLMYWGLFLGLAALIMFVRILPFELRPGRLPGPDWIVIIVFAWVLRRPSYVPVALAAAVFLLNDILYLRPPGLWPGLCIIAMEYLRSRARYSREVPFFVEWGMVTIILTCIILMQHLVLAIFVVDRPTLAMDVVQILVTAAAYPAVVIVTAVVFGIHKVAPGELDRKGHQI